MCTAHSLIPTWPHKAHISIHVKKLATRFLSTMLLCPAQVAMAIFPELKALLVPKVLWLRRRLLQALFRSARLIRSSQQQAQMSLARICRLILL